MVLVVLVVLAVLVILVVLVVAEDVRANGPNLVRVVVGALPRLDPIASILAVEAEACCQNSTVLTHPFPRVRFCRLWCGTTAEQEDQSNKSRPGISLASL